MFHVKPFVNDQMPCRELTPKQRRFVEEYLVDLNATQAAIRAGYSRHTANEQGARLLAKASVKALLAELQAKRSERTGITQDWVISRLVENVNRAMQATEVLDSKGKPTGEYRYDGAVANRALELLGKNIGMFAEVNLNINAEHVISGELPTAEEWEARNSTQH